MYLRENRPKSKACHLLVAFPVDPTRRQRQILIPNWLYTQHCNERDPCFIHSLQVPDSVKLRGLQGSGRL